MTLPVRMASPGKGRWWPPLRGLVTTVVSSTRETEDHHLPSARQCHPHRQRHRNRALHNGPSYATGAARCAVRACRTSRSEFPSQNVCALLRSGAQRSPRHGSAEHLFILINVRSKIVSALDLRSGSLLRSAQGFFLPRSVRMDVPGSGCLE